jgi:hypothetical protein
MSYVVDEHRSRHARLVCVSMEKQQQQQQQQQQRFYDQHRSRLNERQRHDSTRLLSIHFFFVFSLLILSDSTDVILCMISNID